MNHKAIIDRINCTIGRVRAGTATRDETVAILQLARGQLWTDSASKPNGQNTTIGKAKGAQIVGHDAPAAPARHSVTLERVLMLAVCAIMFGLGVLAHG